jgi:hypothetical protein
MPLCLRRLGTFGRAADAVVGAPAAARSWTHPDVCGGPGPSRAREAGAALRPLPRHTAGHAVGAASPFRIGEAVSCLHSLHLRGGMGPGGDLAGPSGGAMAAGPVRAIRRHHDGGSAAYGRLVWLGVGAVMSPDGPRPRARLDDARGGLGSALVLGLCHDAMLAAVLNTFVMRVHCKLKPKALRGSRRSAVRSEGSERGGGWASGSRSHGRALCSPVLPIIVERVDEGRSVGLVREDGGIGTMEGSIRSISCRPHRR